MVKIINFSGGYIYIYTSFWILNLTYNNTNNHMCVCVCVYVRTG